MGTLLLSEAPSCEAEASVGQGPARQGLPSLSLMLQVLGAIPEGPLAPSTSHGSIRKGSRKREQHHWKQPHQEEGKCPHQLYLEQLHLEQLRYRQPG